MADEMHAEAAMTAEASGSADDASNEAEDGGSTPASNWSLLVRSANIGGAPSIVYAGKPGEPVRGFALRAVTLCSAYEDSRRADGPGAPLALCDAEFAECVVRIAHALCSGGGTMGGGARRVPLDEQVVLGKLPALLAQLLAPIVASPLGGALTTALAAAAAAAAQGRRAPRA